MIVSRVFKSRQRKRKNISIVLSSQRSTGIVKYLSLFFLPLPLLGKLKWKRNLNYGADHERAAGGYCRRWRDLSAYPRWRRAGLDHHRLGYTESGVADCVFNGIENVHLVCLEKATEQE